jgi:prepilin-type N-terminal cleavage/methylation domain-containing protein
MKTRPIRRTAAFTLIEVLTVVAIVAMLATMTYAGLRYAMAKSKSKETSTFISNISRCLEEYRQDRGNYPRPAQDKEEAEVTLDGESWRAGPAMTLYQVLSGDGTDAIRGGDKAPTGELGSAEDEKEPGAGKIYMDTVIAPNKEQIANKEKMKMVETSGADFFVIDSWRHPFRYQVQELDKNGLPSNTSDMFSSAAFELWSYGTLKTASDTEEAQKEWVKSWMSN